MIHPIPSAFTLEPKWRINLKQTAPIVSYKMHPSNHWILPIYSLRIDRRQCVPDSSIFRWLRNLPNGWLIGCEKGQGPLSFPRLQTDVDTQGKKHHAHPDLARNNLTKIHWFHSLPFSQFHALSTSFQSPFRLSLMVLVCHRSWTYI